MKKIILLVVLAAICMGTGTFLFGQSQQFSSESYFYYFTYPIEKIYIYRLGYMIVYRGTSNLMSRTFVPHDWFTGIGEGSKGEIVYLGPGREWPAMTVYFNNGEFSHVRLKLRRDRAHETWGYVPLNINLDDYFQGIEEIYLEH